MRFRVIWHSGLLNIAAAFIFLFAGVMSGRLWMIVGSLIILFMGYFKFKRRVKGRSEGEILWKEYIKEHPEYRKARCIAWYFGGDEKVSNQKARDARDGIIKGASYFAGIKQEFPQKGDVSIVLDWEDHPVCILETVETFSVPFNEVTEEMAALENMELKEWKKQNEKTFRQISKSQEHTFEETDPVFFEKYIVLKKCGEEFEESAAEEAEEVFEEEVFEEDASADVPESTFEKEK